MNLKLVLILTVLNFDFGRSLINPEFQMELNEMREKTKTDTIILSTGVKEREEAEKLMDTLRVIQSNNLNFKSGVKVSDIAAKIIGSKLKTTNIKRLSLYRVKLSVNALIEIINGLNNSKITYLNLSAINKLKISVISVLGKILKDTKITELDLSLNHLNNKAAVELSKYLKSSKIHSLELSFNNIKCKGLIAIGKALKDTEINVLDVSWNIIKNSDAVNLLELLRNTRVTSLHLFSYLIDEIGYNEIIKVIKSNKRLVTVALLPSRFPELLKQILKRNNMFLYAAKTLIRKFKNNQLIYSHQYRKEFEAFELFMDTDILWKGEKNAQSLRKRIQLEICKNYFNIVDVVQKKIVKSQNTGNINIADLPPELIQNICSRLSVSDVA